MTEAGYIVRAEYPAYAREKATPEQFESLDALLELVAEVDELECSFGEHLQPA